MWITIIIFSSTLKYTYVVLKNYPQEIFKFSEIKILGVQKLYIYYY